MHNDRCYFKILTGFALIITHGLTNEKKLPIKTFQLSPNKNM